MSNATTEFFDGLARRGYEPELKNVSGTIRFDLTRDHCTEHWFVEIKDGELSVSRQRREPDTLIRTDEELFDRIVTGEAGSVAAWVRCQFKIWGSLPLLRLFERLFPGPVGARDPRQVPRAKVEAPHEEASPPGEERPAGSESCVSILDGNVFAVTDGRGNMDPLLNFPTGFFAFDTRFLSRWRLSINDRRLHALSVDDLQYYEARFFLVPGSPSHRRNAKCSLIRRLSIGSGFDEQLTVLNHQNVPIDLRVRMDIGTDFADLSQIKDVYEEKKGKQYIEVEGGCLRMRYVRETFCRETIVSSTETAHIDEGGMTFEIRIEPHQEWSTTLHVVTLSCEGREMRTALQGIPSRPKPQMRQDLDDWLAQAPKLRCDWPVLSATYERSLVDLAALRFRLLGVQTNVPLAGLPWFMHVFGRDSILASLQTLSFTPEFAVTTLLLGTQCGRKLDDFRDEEPGKIWQETGLGEAAAFEERPNSPSFDAADITPLWLVLLDEYERWTGDNALVRRLEREGRKCLAWIDSYADALGNGYIWYHSRNPRTSMANQCWKSSWDSISYQDGTLPDFPRATCELQGYAYDAKIRAARLARQFWNDPGYADQLEREAADLKERFNRDFWIEDRQYYALAIDPDGRRVDALTSNIGHLLWSGIATPDRAKSLATHLIGPQLFSGWGVRTLAADARRYNPVGYHIGTIWPSDNSLIAWGLRRYGLVEEAACIADAIIDASQFFDNRLPEALAGYDREQTKYPVRYPNACYPHATSAGSVLLLLRSMLGLEPSGQHLIIEPSLPDSIGRLELLDIPGRWGRADAFGRGRIEVEKVLRASRAGGPATTGV